jgi:hypothetical protein
MIRPAPSIERIQVSAYTIPTRTPESDGTFEWDKTTLVLVEAFAGGGRPALVTPMQTRARRT